MKLEDLFEDNTSCDNIWILSLILLALFNPSDKKADTIINVYINGDKVGE